jgi:hypothetical protein
VNGRLNRNGRRSLARKQGASDRTGGPADRGPDAGYGCANCGAS